MLRQLLKEFSQKALLNPLSHNLNRRRVGIHPNIAAVDSLQLSFHANFAADVSGTEATFIAFHRLDRFRIAKVAIV